MNQDEIECLNDRINMAHVALRLRIVNVQDCIEECIALVDELFPQHREQAIKIIESRLL